MSRAVRVAFLTAVVAVVVLGAVPRVRAVQPVARAELARGLHALADRLDRDLPVQAASESVPAGLDPRELRRRLATAQRELDALGGSDHWLDPFFERQDEAGDDVARAALARDAAASLRLIGDEVDAALAARASTAERARHDTEARAALDRVLAEAEFRRFPRDVHPSGAFNRGLTRLLDWWRQWSAPGLPAAMRFFADWTSAIVFALTLALFAWILYGVAARARRARALAERSDASGATPASTLAELDAQVREGLASGAFRDALRAAHLATLGRLRAAGAVGSAQGLTHWDHLAGLRGAQAPGAALERLAALNREFDEAWYGHASIDHDRFERFRSTTRIFLEEMRRFAPGPSIPAP